ncbi:MAG: tyrosine-type recombinase/integrase [Solirubrobacterales bacterium]
MAVKRRHSDGCAHRKGKRCNCKAGWQASVYSARDGKPLRRTFPLKGEAVSWEADTKRQVDQGGLRVAAPTTLNEAAEVWLAGAEAGTITNRSGDPFAAATLRGYRRDLERRILPELGGQKLGSITVADVQALVDTWEAEKRSASAIRNAVKPLQAIYRRARVRSGLAVNPTHDLELPANRSAKVEIVSIEVADALLAAVPDEDRPVWATALYAGLRYGELQALRWGRVNRAEGTIAVEESWDPKEGPKPPKSPASLRVTPIPAPLREVLLDHWLRQDDPAGDALVFGTGTDDPFQAEGLYRRADAAWKAAELTERLRLHKARHTYASLMIAAGVNALAITRCMGHSSITVTYDRYGHLMPGTEGEAANLVSEYVAAQLAEGEQAARAADLTPAMHTERHT